MGEEGGEGKMLLKNICEEVHMSVNLPAISLQACKFTKNELIHRGHRFWWEYDRVFLCNIANVTENKWVTRAKLGGKILMSKNTSDVR